MTGTKAGGLAGAVGGLISRRRPAKKDQQKKQRARVYERRSNNYNGYLHNYPSPSMDWETKEMTEWQAIDAIEKTAEMYYRKTKDKWWLKLAIYAEKKLNNINDTFQEGEK